MKPRTKLWRQEESAKSSYCDKSLEKEDQQMLIGSDRLLKASDIQRELGVSRATAYRMMKDGTLPVYRFGGRDGVRPMVRVSLRELHEWRTAHRMLPTC